ncbi:MAG: excinuclease ABC subunit UvrC, partial [Deltaproteobacteria bacterium]|nr:excinuclease ABC subunit UvrC [Deltaproteobacteria bacterium]
ADKIDSFPQSPGVYLMKDAQGRVIYVGKANELRKRVQTYFRDQKERVQIRFLMNRVTDIDFLVTDSEKEALLLENTLIKKHKPRYNLQLRDDKSYLSLKLSVKDPFPRLYVTRQIKKDGSLYFGPYTSAKSARETLEFIEKYFRLRTCSDVELKNRVRPCLQYQIHRCDAPCVGYTDEENYRRLVIQVKLFLEGKKKDLLQELEEAMEQQSEREEFEKAAATRDLIASIQKTLEQQKVDRHRWIDQDVVEFHREGELVTFCLMMIREGKVWESLFYHLKGYGEDEEVLEGFLGQFYHEERLLPDEILLPRFVSSADFFGQIFSERRGKKVDVLFPQRGDRLQLIHLAHRNARAGFERRAKKGEEVHEILTGLQEALHLQNFPRRIECFDNSNIQGKAAVASLVSFVDGMPAKDGYRRFKIKTVHQPDDYATMREVLTRRLLKEVDDPKWERPDLMVIDGGKGQLNAVQSVMQELNVIGIDLISLAKEKEGENQDKVFLMGRKNPVLLGRRSNLLHLLMRVRDEAHRFAISYHRKIRQQEAFK